VAQRRNPVSVSRRSMKRSAADFRAPKFLPAGVADPMAEEPSISLGRVRAIMNGLADAVIVTDVEGDCCCSTGLPIVCCLSDDGDRNRRVEHVRRVPRSGHADSAADRRAAAASCPPGRGRRRLRDLPPGTRGPEGRWISVSSRPILDGHGRIEGSVTTVRDITARKRQLERHHLLSNIVEETADAVLVTDNLGHIVYVNAAFERTTGSAGPTCWARTRDCSSQGCTPGTSTKISGQGCFGAKCTAGRSSTAGRTARFTCRARPSPRFGRPMERSPTWCPSRGTLPASGRRRPRGRPAARPVRRAPVVPGATGEPG